MTIINYNSLRQSIPTTSFMHYQASQELMDVLLSHRFVEMPQMCGRSYETTTKIYKPGSVYYFRKNGQCTINFLKDGRVHVLHGPIALWNLNDHLTTDDVDILLAFANLYEEQQECFRNYMAPRCQKFSDVLHQLPTFHVDWKRDFLDHLNVVREKTRFQA
jgi:hypothetical protein